MLIKNKETITQETGEKNISSNLNFTGKKIGLTVQVTRNDTIKNTTISRDELRKKE